MSLSFPGPWREDLYLGWTQEKPCSFTIERGDFADGTYRICVHRQTFAGMVTQDLFKPDIKAVLDYVHSHPGEVAYWRLF